MISAYKCDICGDCANIISNTLHNLSYGGKNMIKVICLAIVVVVLLLFLCKEFLRWLLLLIRDVTRDICNFLRWCLK